MNNRNLNTVITLDWIYVVYGAIFISAPGGDEQNQIKIVRKRNVTTFYEDFKKYINSLELEVTYLEQLQYLPYGCFL